MKTVRMLCIMVGSVLAAFLIPLAARAWLASPRPVEAPVVAAWNLRQKVSTNDYGMRLYPAAVAQGDQVYAMWSKLAVTGTTDYDPYYNQAGNYGDLGEWGADTPVAASDSKTENVDMAVDSAGGRHFVWTEAAGGNIHTLYYFYNVTGKEPIAQYDSAVVPAVAVGDTEVHVVWSQGSADIMYNNKTIGTSGWPVSTTVRSSSTSVLGNPAIAVDSSGRAHVAWDEGDPGSADILYKNSDDWSGAPVTVSNDPSEEGDGRRPAIAASGSNVYVVWCEYISDENQYVRFGQSTAWGSSARISSRLTANADIPTYLRPDITVDDDGKLHVVFNGGMTGVPSDPEKIFYASSSDGVNWWSWPISDPTPQNATTPAVAVSGGYIHVIWAEKWDGQYEVIHRRKEPTQGGDLYLPIIMKSY